MRPSASAIEKIAPSGNGTLRPDSSVKLRSVQTMLLADVRAVEESSADEGDVGEVLVVVQAATPQRMNTNAKRKSEYMPRVC